MDERIRVAERAGELTERDLERAGRGPERVEAINITLRERAEVMLLGTRGLDLDPDAVAAELGLGLVSVSWPDWTRRWDWASERAVVLPGWKADDGNCPVDYPDAESGEEAAAEYVESGDWGERDQTDWVDICAWQEALLLVREGDDYALDVVRVNDDEHTVTLEPDEPECTGEDHDWQSPHDLVGGLRCNPGVRGSGGGVVIHEVCVVCGCARITDTWAQRRDTGEQGLTSVRYDTDDTSLRDWLDGLGVDDLDLDVVAESEDSDEWAVSVGGPHSPLGSHCAVVEVEGGEERVSVEWCASEDEARAEAAERVERFREAVTRG